MQIVDFIKQHAIAFVLAFPLFFFIIAGTDFVEKIPAAFRNSELILLGLFAFCFFIVVLIISLFTWLWSRSVSVIKLVSALPVRRCQLLRTAYDTRQFAKRRIANAVAALSPQEKTFLELFCADGVALQRTTCAPLPHQTYVAHQGLIKNGLVIKIEDAECLPVEHFALAAEAIPLLQKLVYDGKEPQTEIELLFDHVAHSGSSGSPPVGRSPRR